ncbi:carbohydrate kinase [Endozoicomonas sp. SM1973]|uniref:Carbohydrate kinase n=1 Tax=Spartinivicinus marinus TaxID=2994442 RepID=A0A853IE22_9GAMM|nr:FGGY-family carbohydrate kinase [Spartinivicinus marinus]NYZ67757.1 carbohydrate kinase [Spartinivicinus marinus]
MTQDPLILAIDNGTQSVRALVFNLAGQLQYKTKIPLQPYFSPKPGWAEQQPEYYWQSVVAACQQLWQLDSSIKQRLAGVTVTTQRGTVIAMNKQGRPLRPAILWLDQRRAELRGKVPQPWRLLFAGLGLNSTVNYFRSKAQANWLVQYEPELWEQTDKFLLLSGYLNYQLTGEWVDSIGSMVGYLPFDYKRLAWARPKDWKWMCSGVAPEQLPRLVAPTTIMGQITQQAAEQTGIPAGLPVIASASDKACEVLGSGGITPDIGCLSYGTTATINTTNAKYIEPIRFIPPYPAAVPTAYNTEVMIYRGYWMVSWFKEQFGLKEQQLAEVQGTEPETLFDELVESVPAGSMGLMLQPYWSPGLKEPAAKGAILGFGDVHTRAHMYRAILEGLTYALREGKETIERRAKTPITQLRVSGGGAQSQAAMQITADIFNMPAVRPHTFETSGLGAAIDAAVGLKLHSTIETAVQQMVHTGDVFEPIKENADRYNALYNEVYLKMYRQLKPFYQTIRKITGYPE